MYDVLIKGIHSYVDIGIYTLTIPRVSIFDFNTIEHGPHVVNPALQTSQETHLTHCTLIHNQFDFTQ